MADKSSIEWTDATWNPVTGCSLVSEGCRNCYAAELAATRLSSHPSRAGLAKKNVAGVAQFNGKVRFNEGWLYLPLDWKKPRRIFVCAHADLFHENVPDAWIDKIFAVMALCPQHTFQVLTKRPERMRKYLTRKAGEGLQDIRNHLACEVVGQVMSGFAPVWKSEGVDGKNRSRVIQACTEWPLPNVWLGVSIEDQVTADTRIPYLLGTPAAVRFVSAEPLLGAVDLTFMDVERRSPAGFYAINSLTGWNDDVCRPCPDVPKLDWVIVGGESGRNARPVHPDWVRSLRDQCQAAAVPFLFKQWGNWLPWEPDTAPFWMSQNDGYRDGHTLFPDDIERDCKWDDGLGFVAEGQSHIAFQRVKKYEAGRALDGVTYDGFPGVVR